MGLNPLAEVVKEQSVAVEHPRDVGHEGHLGEVRGLEPEAGNVHPAPGIVDLGSHQQGHEQKPEADVDAQLTEPREPGKLHAVHRPHEPESDTEEGGVLQENAHGVTARPPGEGGAG